MQIEMIKNPTCFPTDLFELKCATSVSALHQKNLLSVILIEVEARLPIVSLMIGIHEILPLSGVGKSQDF